MVSFDEFDYQGAYQTLDRYRWLLTAAPPNSFFLEAYNSALTEKLWEAFGDEAYSLEDLLGLLKDGSSSDTSKTAEFIRKCNALAAPLFQQERANAHESAKQRAGMKVKKSHEVDLLAQLLLELAEADGIVDLVDVGAGQGYLDMALAEMNDRLRIVALERDRVQLKGILGRSKAKERIEVVPFEITGTTICADLDTTARSDGYMLYSLHACGSLSDNMLRLFAGSGKCKTLVNVGCCYNLIDQSFQFPISRELSGQCRALEWQEKMAACQAPRTWTREGAGESVTKNYYRAVLELALARLHPCKGFELGRTRLRIGDGFTTYATAAFKKLGLVLDSTATLVLGACESACATGRQRHALYWTARACLGQIVECLILFDRLLYLRENMAAGGSAKIVPLFDISKSPRRMAILATKGNVCHGPGLGACPKQ